MNKNNIEVTVNLDKAAFLMLQGAEIIGFKGKHHYNCRVIINTDHFALSLVTLGMVNYKDYMKMRKKIKIKIKKAYGYED